MPKVSICIPAYSQTAVLRKTLDSIQSQTFQDYEVVITDDSPSSDVAELLKEFNFKGRLKYYHNPKSLGSPVNWNYCISKAKGDYIKILHHDDWFTYDDSLENYIKLLDDSPNALMAFSGSVVILDNFDSWIHSISKEQLNDIRNNPISLYTGNKIGSPSAIIVRRENHITFDPNLKWLVDIDFYMKVMLYGNLIAHTSRPLITTFAAKGRLTDECSNDKRVEIFEYFSVLENLVRTFPQVGQAIIKPCYSHAINICFKYGVTKVSEIRECGYNGKIPFYIRKRLFFRKQTLGLKFIFNHWVNILRNGHFAKIN